MTSPEERLREAENALREARLRLARGDTSLAAELVWDAVALAVKACAQALGLPTDEPHGLWRSKDRVAEEIPGALEAFQRAAGLQLCAQDHACTPRDVETVAEAAEKLIHQARKCIERRA